MMKLIWYVVLYLSLGFISTIFMVALWDDNEGINQEWPGNGVVILIWPFLLLLSVAAALGALAKFTSNKIRGRNHE